MAVKTSKKCDAAPFSLKAENIDIFSGELANQGKPATSSASKQLIDGELLTPTEFCTKLNAYYAQVGGVALPMTEQLLCVDGETNSCIEHVSLGEIKLYLARLDPTKATSSEDFPTWISRDGKDDICIPLQDIINCMLSTCQFPNKWKRAQITPVPKTSSPTQCKDYRPISLLYHLGKLAEDIIISKMRSRLTDILESTQFAYRPNIGTADALIQFLDDHTRELDKASVKYVQNAFLDFSKAFDCLQPAILIEKMSHYGFNRNTVKLLASFLSSRKHCVKYSDVFSDYVSIEVGSPQGTKVEPILWPIFKQRTSKLSSMLTILPYIPM
jgi:hypothetical protein